MKLQADLNSFFDEDKPRLLTPKEVLGLKSVSGVTIKELLNLLIINN